MPQTHRQDGHDKGGEQGDDKTGRNPYKPVGTHDCVEEFASGVKSQTCQEERQSDTAQHEVGTACRIRHHVKVGAEPSDEYSHHDGASGQTELYRHGYAGNGDGY